METSYISRTSGIGTRDKIGYAMGDLASLLVFGLVQSVLQKYYTDVLGIGVVSIMVMFIIARVWDAINDPLWGRIIDRIPPAPDGRYRRWLKTLALPVALSAVLMFVKIPGLSEGGYLAYAYVTYILFGMLYTGINIPYGSLAQVITSDDRERSSLSVFRSIGSTFGAMPAMLLISFCYVKNANGTSVMSYSKILTGAAIIAAILVNMALLRIGYTDNVLNTANITGGTLDMMFTDSVLIPAVLYFLIFVILRFMYPLGREKIAQLQKEKEKLLSKLAEE